MSSGILMGSDGPPCACCKKPMAIYEHRIITERMLQQPYYYFRWYRCLNHDCVTTVVWVEEFKVVNPPQRTMMDHLADSGILPL
jgi:hypothetical protein